MIGLSTCTMRSRSGQSVNEQLPILTMSKSCASIRSTERSSNGVHIARKPARVISSRSALELLRREARVLEALDVVEFGGAAVVGVDERVQVPVLELHGEVVRKPLERLGELADDPDPVIQAAHVVVRHLEDEQRCDVTEPQDSISPVPDVVPRPGRVPTLAPRLPPDPGTDGPAPRRTLVMPTRSSGARPRPASTAGSTPSSVAIRRTSGT